MAVLIDPMHLLEDELAEEFAVRHIVETGDAGIAKLRLTLASEHAGVTPKPKALSNVRQASEMRACRDKLKVLSNIYQDVIRESDDSIMSVLQSRVIHLQDRVNRLHPVAQNYDGIFDLVSEVNQFCKSLDEVRMSIGSNETLANDDTSEGASNFEQISITTTSVTDTPIMATSIQPPTQPHPNVSSDHLSQSTTSLPESQTSSAGSFIFNPARNSMPFTRIPPPNSDAGIIAAMQQQRHVLATGFQTGRTFPNTGTVPKQTSVANRQQTWNFNSNTSSVPQQTSTSANHLQTWYYPPIIGGVPPQASVNHSPSWNFTPYPGPLPTSCPSAPNLGFPPEHPYQGFQANIPDPVVNNNAGGRPGLMYQMGKWNLQFRGTTTEFPVDEFLFRVETLARSSNIAENMLPFGMHYVLHGAAQDWYWVYHRDNPHADWDTFKGAMRRHFSLIETQVEIREKISKRKQRSGEAFNDFYLAVAGLAARLNQRMPDNELVEILRANMAPQLKSALLFHPTQTVATLQEYCKRYERLWQVEAVSANRQPKPSFTPRVHEIFVPVEPIPYGVQQVDPNVYYDASQYPYPYAYADQVEAIQKHDDQKKAANRSDLMICWNCDEMGHTFDVCTVATRNVFCYGCGLKNNYKPTCTRCNAGNRQRDGSNQGPIRPNQQPRAPNPFLKR